MIKDNINEILGNIEKQAAIAGVDPGGITLVAVSKTKPAALIKEAYDTGLRDFGENRVQEYLEKREILPDDIKWNVIGRLQTNKVKYIINNIWLLHSLDRISLAEELQMQCARHDCSINALLQVNMAMEETKAGFYLEELERTAAVIAGMDRIRILGMMTIAPNTDDKRLLRSVFAKTKKCFDKLSDEKYDNFTMRFLSMGMSGDYEEAILEGSNMVRIGSAIFGDRS